MLTIGHGVSLSDDTFLGENVSIGNNVTIYPKVIIDDNCIIFDGAVIGRPPRTTGNTTRPLNDNSRQLRVGPGSVIGANVVLYEGITLGARVLIGDLATIREGCDLADDVVFGRSAMMMYETKVGARTRIVDGAILTGNMIVEEDVFIGPGANSINDNDVYFKRFGLEAFSVKGPVVRRFALIGAGANLAADVEVGKGAIAAPNAMIINNVPPWTIVAGIPARPVGEVSLEDQRRLLLHFGLDKEP